MVQWFDSKDIELFGKNLVDVVWKTGRSVEESQKYDLILEMAVPGWKTVFYLSPSQILIQ